MTYLQGSTATVLLALLLQSVKPALTQTSVAAAPTTVPPNYATEYPSGYQEYNFTYPEYLTGEPIVASYKDIIDVSWTSTAPSDPPSLTIRCWIRNATTGLTCTHSHVPSIRTAADTYTDWHQSPNLTTELVSHSEANMADFPLNLTVYKPYSPCELMLQDPRNFSSNNTVFSNPFFISDTNRSAGVTWSADNPAPLQSGTEGLEEGSKSSAGRLHVGASLGYASLVGLLSILLML